MQPTGGCGSLRDLTGSSIFSGTNLHLDRNLIFGEASPWFLLTPSSKLEKHEEHHREMYLARRIDTSPFSSVLLTLGQVVLQLWFSRSLVTVVKRSMSGVTTRLLEAKTSCRIKQRQELAAAAAPISASPASASSSVAHLQLSWAAMRHDWCASQNHSAYGLPLMG